MSIQPTSVRLPTELHEKLHVRSHLESIVRKKRISVSSIIVELLQKAMENGK